MTATFTRRGLVRAGVAAGAAVLLAASGAAAVSAVPAGSSASATPSASASKSAPKSARASRSATATADASYNTDGATDSSADSPAAPVQSKTGWVALADDSTHELTIWHNGDVVKTMPISMGSAKHPTPNGTYYTMEKHRSMIMSSATYGVPVDSAEGYSTYVEYATRMSWDGIFIHAAPWSVAQQGVSNVSHGCINISTTNAKYVFDNFPTGTPIVVRGTSGGQYTGS